MRTRPARLDRLPLRDLAAHALSRAAGAPLVAGHALRLLRDAGENYPAWLAALRGARRQVSFENYIFANDGVGGDFAEALAAAAARGVRVRVLHDWLGCLGERSRPLWRALRAAGAEVRSFNPPQPDRPLEWLSRDHRKSLVVDGEVAFVSGLCVSDRWLGTQKHGGEPWRDTGLELRGPAVAEVERAFAGAWTATGAPFPAVDLARPPLAAGDVAVRVIATEPSHGGVFRLDLLVAALATHSLWLADAYFFGTSAYIEALRAAARDGVDVRLLVPGASDLRLLAPLSRAGYRPLLEAGVRVFEWDGSMMHAKTAVADGRWGRVGSSNLNLASWIGNWELDVTVEDAGVAGQLEASYLADLGHATEVVLRRARRRPPRSRRVRGSAGPAAAGAIRLGHAVGAALTGQRTLGPAEARVAAVGGLALVLGAVAALFWPRLLSVPAAVVALWLGATLVYRALRLARRSRAAEGEAEGAPPSPGEAPAPGGRTG